MHGESPLRFGAGGWLLIATSVVVVLALVAAALAHAVPASVGARLMAGGSFSVTPRSVTADTRSVAVTSVGAGPEVPISSGWTINGPLGSPGPGPTDAPFGTEIDLSNNANAQTHASVAGEASGSVLYAAWTDQAGPTDRNVVAARSTNGGTTWNAVTVAGSATYNEFDPRVVVHGARVYILYAHDDASNPRQVRYLLSLNQGASWTPTNININNPPFRDYRVPDGADFNGQYMYATWQTFCDVAANCNGVTQSTYILVAFDAVGAIVGNTILYDPQTLGGVATNQVDPTVLVTPNWVILATDLDGNNPVSACTAGQRDLFNELIPMGSINTGIVNRFVFQVCSDDNLRLDGAGFGTNSVLLLQFVASPNNHVIGSLYNNLDGDQGGWTLALVAGSAGTEFKDPAIFASIPLLHATFYQGGDLEYTYSSDAAATWSPPFKVNSNTGSAQDAVRSNDVTYASGVRVAWQDNRAGNDEIYFSQFSGWAFYIFDRSPSQGQLTIDTNGVAVPVAYLWQSGTSHTADAPTPDQTAPDTRLVFTRWSDGNTNPSRTIIVGASDQTLVAMYTTEYLLTMTAAVGTTTPTTGWYVSGASVPIRWDPPAPSPGVRYIFSDWTGFGAGSYTGNASSTTIVMLEPITEVANALRQFQVIVDTDPPASNLRVIVDGTTYVAPSPGLWWNESSSHTIQAIDPQSPTGPTQRFVFDQWMPGGSPNPTQSVTATAPVNYTAFFHSEYQVTINTNPSGRQVIVDSGAPQTAPINTWWRSGTTHTVDVTSPQIVADTRYTFVSWSDGQPQSHSIGPVSAPVIVTATFTTEYRYVFDATPAGLGLNVMVDGLSLPAPATVWWQSGTTHNASFVTIQIAPDTRRALQQWFPGGDTTNPRTFASVSGPGSYTAQTILQYRYRLDTNPTGLPLYVDGSGQTTLYTAWWDQGSTHTVEFRNFSAPDTRQVFVQWSDGSVNAFRTFSGIAGPNDYTATVVAQYRYLFDTVPTGLTLLVDGSPCMTPCAAFWWDQGSSHSAQFQTFFLNPPTNDQRRAFAIWSDADQTNPRTFAGVAGPKTLTATTQVEYRYLLDTSPTGLSLTVDGSACTAQCTAWFAAGSSHSVEFASPQPGVTDVRYVFASWSDGGVTNPRTLSGVSTSLSLTAQTRTEFRLTFDVSPASTGIAISVGGSWITTPGFAWVPQGSVTIMVNATTPAGTGTRYAFDRWSGADTGTTASRTITISAPGSYVANLNKQYQLTVTGLPSGVIATCSVADCWYNDGTAATVTLSTTDLSTGTGMRTHLVSWSGDATGTGASGSVGSMSAPKTAGTVWRDQVLVKVVTDPALTGLAITVTVNGADVTYDANGMWVDLGASVVVTVPQSPNVAGQSYTFASWDTGETSTSKTVTASTPRTLTARYQTANLVGSPAFLGGLIAAIVAAILIAFLLMRRRKQGPEAMAPATAGAALQPPTAPMAPTVLPPPGEGPTMQCPSCGMTIPAVAGACPICGTQVAPPAPAAAPAQDERVQRLTEAYQSGRISKEQYQANMKRLRGNA